ncbi:MAG: alpha-galactosidase [Opitutaceae bacterium]|nr:alpha-galactosidase [Opitutaceae bacterium]
MRGICACALLAGASFSARADAGHPLAERVRAFAPAALGVDGRPLAEVKIVGAWRGAVWSGRIENQSALPVSVRDALLFEGEHGLSGDTPVYGESFQMLAQITGTLAGPADLGVYPDRTHYRIPEPEGYRTASGALALSPAGADVLVLGFASCRAFIGRIGFNADRLRVYQDLEGVALAPGESRPLEDFYLGTSASRASSLAALADRLAAAHGVRPSDAPPIGWCSWYSFYEDVTAADVRENLAWAKKHLPGLRYVQIDDGFQPRMGDWLEAGPSFGGDVRGVLEEIKRAGFEPALWVAPFIAEKDSAIFRNHPDWFVKGPDGLPLNSSTVGFGGWRRGPWYVLDGTHPEVARHLETLFHTLREEWGVTYFKLDANYWGAIHGGRRHDAAKTRIEAYRAGMEAIRRGAGDAFILGCNAPMWPSVGLVDGMRTSGDINNTRDAVLGCARENLARLWQNGRLWWNDPDCILLCDNTQQRIRKGLPARADAPDEALFQLHAASVHAVGGMVFSGDHLPQIPAERVRVLREILATPGRAMEFSDDHFQLGRRTLANGTREIALFNWTDAVASHRVDVPAGASVTDLWTGRDEPAPDGALDLELPPFSARVLRISR